MFAEPLVDTERRITFMLQGINGLGLTVHEWHEQNGVHIAAIRSKPADASPDEDSGAQSVAISLPGVGKSRIEALHAALNAWHADSIETETMSVTEVKETNIHDPAALQFAYKGLKRAMAKR